MCEHLEPLFTCMVTSLSSIWISFVRKSAPIVALYSLENFFCTYWFMSDVLPTLQQGTTRVSDPKRT